MILPGGTQAIVYILSSFGCAKAPKRIALRPVRIIPVWHAVNAMPHKIRMKTIFAFSDIHEGTLPPRLLAVAEESDYVFFLGDGAARMGDLALHKGFFAVKGNCDYLPLPEETVTEVEGVKILLTHGHRYGVKTDLLSLALRAEELGCRLVFFGHTHTAEIVEHGAVTLVNPGSLTHPSFGTPTYAYTVITEGRAFTKLVPAL